MLGKRRFSVAAPSVWDSLPLNLRTDYNSLRGFKTNLKTHFSARTIMPVSRSASGYCYMTWTMALYKLYYLLTYLLRIILQRTYTRTSTKYTMDQELPDDAAYTPGRRRFVCFHQMAALFCEKWRHGRQPESETSYLKSYPVNHCIFTLFATFHPDPIWNDGTLWRVWRASAQQEQQQDE